MFKSVLYCTEGIMKIIVKMPKFDRRYINTETAQEYSEQELLDATKKKHPHNTQLHLLVAKKKHTRKFMYVGEVDREYILPD